MFEGAVTVLLKVERALDSSILKLLYSALLAESVSTFEAQWLPISKVVVLFAENACN